MITKDRTTADGISVHASLFNRAREQYELATGKELPEINTIADYFTHLGAILEATGDFTLAFLPGDEPCFEINGNTRLITIPSEFQKNGVAVVGDDSAEILVFKVDRYFDATDLYDSKEYYIQWETPAGKNYNKAYERIQDNFVACPYNGDYVIFGWPLHDAVTGSAGNITLSVHILQYADNDELREDPIYSFNTQPIKLKINQSGLLEESQENENVDNIYSFLSKRLLNTKSHGHNSQIKVSTPYLLALTPLEADLNENGEYTFKVAGYTKANNTEDVFATGTLAYRWNEEGAVEEYVSISLIDSTYIDFFQKFVLNDNGQYELYDSVEHGENAELYVKISNLTVDSVGSYNSMFTNTLDTVIGKSEKIVFTIPGPQEVVIAPVTDATQVIEDSLVLSVKVESNHEKDLLSYEWFKDDVVIENSNNVQLTATESGRYHCVVTALRNKAQTNATSESWSLIPKPVVTIISDLSDTANSRDLINFSIESNVEYNRLVVKWYKQDQELLEKTYNYGTNYIEFPQSPSLNNGDVIYAKVQIFQTDTIMSDIVETKHCTYVENNY